jgi:hypothetical protein
VRRSAGETLFLLLVTGLAITLLAQTRTLSPVSRLVPLWVLAPTLALIALLWLIEIRPRLAARWSFLQEHDYFSTRRLLDRGLALTGPPASAWSGPATLGWFILMPGLVWAVGIWIAAPLYTFIYLVFRARASWFVSALVAAAMGAIGYGARWLIGAP